MKILNLHAAYRVLREAFPKNTETLICIFFELARNAPVPVPFSKVTTELNKGDRSISQAALSKSMNVMEELSIARRIPDMSDHKKINIELLPKGLALVKTLEALDV